MGYMMSGLFNLLGCLIIFTTVVVTISGSGDQSTAPQGTSALDPELSGSGQEEVHLMALVPYSGEVWPAGEAILLAFNMALDHINARQDILPGYTLRLHWQDSQVGQSTILFYPKVEICIFIKSEGNIPIIVKIIRTF